MSAHQEHWQVLRAAGLVSGDLPAAPPRPARFIRALQGFAAWVASLFVIGFLVTLLDFDDDAGGLFVTGVLLLGGAWLALKQRGASDFMAQLALATSLAGQLLVTLAMINIADGNVTVVAAVVLVMAVIVNVIMEDYLQRFIATLAGSFALASICFDWSAPSLALPLLSGACCALWLNEERWGKWRGLLEPVAVAAAVAALVVALFFDGNVMPQRLGFDEGVVPGWVGLAVMTGLLLFTLRRILEDVGARPGPRRLAWYAVLALVGVTMMYALPGSGAGLLLVLLAARSQRITIGALALLLLVLLFARYYYLLELTLLTKSLLLMAGGAILLVLQQVVAALTGSGRLRALSALSWPDRARWLASGVAIAAVAFVLQDAWQNERTLDGGRVVLLQLAPVDPRSLMQGDYMRLRFGVERQLLADLDDDAPLRGHFLVRIGNDGVAEYAGIDVGEALPDDVVRMPFRRTPRGIELLTNAWFFEEGDAATFEDARYGEFRVGSNGRVLLNAMRDAQLNVLGDPRGAH